MAGISPKFLTLARESSCLCRANHKPFNLTYIVHPKMVNLKVIFACTQINPLQAGRNVISYGAYNTTFRAAANGVYPTPPLNKSDISSSHPPLPSRKILPSADYLDFEGYLLLFDTQNTWTALAPEPVDPNEEKSLYRGGPILGCRINWMRFVVRTARCKSRSNVLYRLISVAMPAGTAADLCEWSACGCVGFCD